MAIAFDTRPAQPTGLDSVLNAMRTLARKHAERRAFRATRRELMALTDRNLDDLGLVRSDIDRAALEATISSARS